ncbi:MAG: GntR family transcriptional regulator [Desulfofustis sp.]|jgi:DNA-binding GntR family transcriptional regulator|nr:GntR family transcriptional regulator [Desulfofustis sp.]
MDQRKRSISKVQEIVQALEVDIVIGRLYPREHLVEEQLARRFDTTRHVIRQAIVELDAAGLVVREANKGASVCEYSPDEVNQLYTVREILERQAALMIQFPIDQPAFNTLEKIRAAHAAAVESSDMMTIVATNKTFHQQLFSLCGNQFLSEIINDMAKRSNLVRFTTSTSKDYLRQVVVEHSQILDALAAGDQQRLALLCVEHLQPSRRMYLERKGPLT